jgi:hypothetical protein
LAAFDAQGVKRGLRRFAGGSAKGDARRVGFVDGWIEPGGLERIKGRLLHGRTAWRRLPKMALMGRMKGGVFADNWELSIG